jgi:hypothetical protein
MKHQIHSNLITAVADMNRRHKHGPSFLCYNSTTLLSTQRNWVSLEATFCTLSNQPTTIWYRLSLEQLIAHNRSRNILLS